jgi:hypothetical protein
MSLLQSDRVIGPAVWQTLPLSRSLYGRLTSWLLVLVFLSCYFALCGYVVTHGSIDQSPASSEAMTLDGL